MKLILLLSFFLLTLFAVEDFFEVNYSGYTFSHYLREHNKAYPFHKDFIFRKQIFESRLEKIIAHNNNPAFSWKEGVNQFTDMTEAEMKSYLGLNKKMLYQTQFKRGIVPQMAAPVDPELMANLPDNVDWRTAGIVTPVKNQGSCGSCWAFGSAETVECVLAQKEKKLTALSEQQLVDCVENPNHCGGTGGCDGATVELAWDLIKEKGIAREADYPYTARDGTCKTRDPYTNITSYVNLPSNQQQPILEAVANVAPLAVAVDASNWFGYRSGVFDGCNQKNPDIDHSVQLVGYGTDTKGGDYWLIRNSWGPGYGEKGYIRIKRESGTPRCGTDKKPSDGTGCDDGPPTITVCGTCGILYDALYPII